MNESIIRDYNFQFQLINFLFLFIRRLQKKTYEKCHHPHFYHMVVIKGIIEIQIGIPKLECIWNLANKILIWAIDF